MAKQTKTGKAFEYALLKELENRLTELTNVEVTKNDPYVTAKNAFDSFGEEKQEAYKINSSTAINFLLDIEPRLKHGIDDSDILRLELVSDQAGQSGDVRDVLMIRSSQNWEIGISAKNNHRAVKHSRLSQRIDFGKKWLDVPCSDNYFAEIKPIFDNLTQIRSSDPNSTWDVIDDMHENVYVKTLNAFAKELRRLDESNPGIVAERMVQYLIGSIDFYKVIKGKSQVEIHGYNIHGTLNMSFQNIKPKAKIRKIRLPSRIIEIRFKEDSKTTIIVSMDQGWQISFRIHSAKSTVEPSLKFDINLISSPHSLFTTSILL
ncbi:HaeIII family restriction endonuclease [Christiangramia marina]|uniref:HaeIII family restriction endonuclease n=1 Tax=Christiangramia marina TaxID=409436 RepID=UPI003AA962DB